MADIELVIKIPEEIYGQIKDGYVPLGISKYLKNGIPLDLEGLKSDMKALNCGYPYGLDYLLDCLKQRLGITIADINKQE